MRTSRLGVNILHVLLLLLVAPGLAPDCMGQSSEEPKTEVWIDVTKFFPVANSLRVGGDTGVRGFFFEKEYTGLFIRPSLEYLYRNGISFHGGLGYFYAFLDGPTDVREIRPWGGVKVRWPTFRSVHLENYFRGEGRFLSTIGTTEKASVLRLRHRIGTVLPLADKQPGGKGFYAPVSFEVFFRAGGDVPARFINQTRFLVGIGYQLGSGWRLETSYNWIQFKPNAGDEFITSTHLIRIQIKG